jgi:hypothetical protein
VTVTRIVAIIGAFVFGLAAGVEQNHRFLSVESGSDFVFAGQDALPRGDFERSPLDLRNLGRETGIRVLFPRRDTAIENVDVPVTDVFE